MILSKMPRRLIYDLNKAVYKFKNQDSNVKSRLI